jgi:glycosyltransferase involved in cell wall biosynthesis
MTSPGGAGRPPVVYILSPQFPHPPQDGGRIGIYYRIRELVRRGYRVHLVATAKSDEPVGDHTPLHEWCASVTVVRRRSGLDALRAWLSFRPFQVTSRDTAELRGALRALHAREPADIIECEHSSMAAFRDPALRGSRWVIAFHNLEYRGALNRARSAWPNPMCLLLAVEGLRLWPYERALVRSGSFAACLFLSSAEMEEAQRWAPRGRSLLALIPAGSDVPPISAPELRGGRELLFLASLWYDPNIEGLEWFVDSVWPLVREAVPDAHLTVAGRSPGRRARGLVKRTAGATLAGDVPEIDSWIAKASAVVVPTRRGAGIKIKVLEALGRGAVCVCTSYALEGLVLPDEPVALVADDAPAFARHCIAALREDVAARRVAARGRAWVEEHYSWEAIGGALDRVYRRLLAPAADGQARP